MGLPGAGRLSRVLQASDYTCLLHPRGHRALCISDAHTRAAKKEFLCVLPTPAEAGGADFRAIALMGLEWMPQWHRYEAEVTSMRTELTAVSSELGLLRAKSTGRSEPDTKLLVRCQSAVEKDRDDLRNLLVESEKQLATGAA